MNRLAAVIILAGIVIFGGCAPGPRILSEADQKPLDRLIVEHPSGTILKTYARGLTAPCAMAFVRDEGDYKGAMLVAESGAGDTTPRIYGWRADKTFFNVYPRSNRLPPLPIIQQVKKIFGPIGGMVVYKNRIYVTHRDKNGRGVVSSFTFDGAFTTVVGDLPAQGDYSVTDIAVDPVHGRLWFGVGSATNSGVVGLDNFEVGWVKRYPKFCDMPADNLKLLGLKFFTKNPVAGLFGGDDNVSTGPFQPFGANNQLRIPKAPNDKPTSAIYSVSTSGGDLKVEAHGIRLPRGLAFDPYSNLYATNNGMEQRGTRPVKDDPDVLIKVAERTWYGFPDFSTDFAAVSESRFQPPLEMILSNSGYPEVSALVDLPASGLSSPASFEKYLLFGRFPSLSGAAKLDFVPDATGFREYRNSAIVALGGDRGPFATGGEKLRAPVGCKVMRVNLTDKKVEEFIRNTKGGPASAIGRNIEGGLERPVDAKFGPDGRLYILDYGKMEMRGGNEKITTKTGRIFVLEPVAQTAGR